MSSNLSRRQWLRLAGAAVATLGVTGRLFAAPPNGPRFLLVFLRGGYDATNTLVPYSSSFYYESRPTLAIARLGPGAGVTRLGGLVVSTASGGVCTFRGYRGSVAKPFRDARQYRARAAQR